MTLTDFDPSVLINPPRSLAANDPGSVDPSSHGRVRTTAGDFSAGRGLSPNALFGRCVSSLDVSAGRPASVCDRTEGKGFRGETVTPQIQADHFGGVQ